MWTLSLDFKVSLSGDIAGNMTGYDGVCKPVIVSFRGHAANGQIKFSMIGGPAGVISGTLTKK